MAKKKGRKEPKYAYYDEAMIRTATIPETDRTPEVKYTYRPLSIETSAALDSALVAEESPQGVTEAMLKIVSTAVLSWNLRKPDRKNPDNVEGLPVDPKNIEELKNIDEFIIDSIVKEVKGKPRAIEAKAKN